MAAPSHVYETFIRATPDGVWTAITDPAFTKRYFHDTAFTSDLRPGSSHRYVMANGDAAVDGMVEEVEAGKRLVITWNVLYDAAMSEEPPGRVEWVLTPANDDGSVTRVTLRHFDLGMSPLTSNNVALGWVGVLDSMKSLLETGQGLGDLDISPVESGPAEAEHRRLAIKANGETWELLTSQPSSTGSGDAGGDGSGVGGGSGPAAGEAERLVGLLERVNASAYHWNRATTDGAVERVRAAWLQSRCYVVAGEAGLAMRFAERCAALTAACDHAADFDRAYAHEALARAHALAGRLDEAGAARAEAAAETIADDEDRKIFEADLADGPWFALD